MPAQPPPQIRITTAKFDGTRGFYQISGQRPSPTDTIASGYSSIVSYRQGHNSYHSGSSTFSSSSSSTSASSTQSTFPAPMEGFSLPIPKTQFAISLFDFQDPDPAVLSFDRGDVVEVMSMDPSGWWDCIVGTKWNGCGLGGEVRRGWVPSNYLKLLGHRSQAQAALFSRSSKTKMQGDRRRRLEP